MYRKNKKHSDTENPTEGQDEEAKREKEMHIRSRQIMERLLERAKSHHEQEEESNDRLVQFDEDEAKNYGLCHSEHEYFRRGRGRSTPILIAASNGIVEMVEKTLQDLPMTIHDRDSTGKNIVLLAVENRQSHLYDFLLKRSHLLKNYESWLIPSSTLPMHWEVKWYEKKQRMAQQHMQFLLFHCSSNSNYDYNSWTMKIKALFGL
ncbi:hypothetical protein AAG906_020521 [Vitis piasezkii]